METETPDLMDKHPLYKDPLNSDLQTETLDRDHPDKDTLWTETHRQRPPRQRPPGQRLPGERPQRPSGQRHHGHIVSCIFFHFCRAHAGDENGSIYLQAFAKYLQDEYMKRPLDKILKMVRQSMVKKVQVISLPFDWFPMSSSGADPRFSIGGGTSKSFEGGGTPTYHFANFSERTA